MTDEETIAKLGAHFVGSLGLDEHASIWLCQVWHTIQFFDDLADGDPVERPTINAALWDVLVRMPDNPFFKAHAAKLTPILATQIMKWQASDAMEQIGKADARSFVWRAGYYDLVLYVVSLVHSPEVAAASAASILGLYGETLDDYLKEFDHA